MENWDRLDRAHRRFPDPGRCQLGNSCRTARGRMIKENKFDEEMEAEKRGRQSGKHKKVSTTDPDATMSTTARNRRLEP